MSKLSRVIVSLLLVLALVGGSGLAAAAPGDNSGSQCPGDNPTQAYDHVSETAFERSLEGRTTALTAAGCLP